MSAGTSEFFCLICLLVCSCTAQENITAEPGQDVILPCKAPDNKITAEPGQDVILPCKAPDIKDINDINNITAVAWIRPDQDPEYVLLYRDRRFDPDSQYPSYQNRVDLQDKEMKDGNFSLVLKKVTMNDTGRYECRVSQSGKTELISIIYLEVYDHSWIIVGVVVGVVVAVVVAVVVGVLVCLLLAAAVFLYRQNRKRKILERTIQHWMEMRRNLQNSIQNMNKELNEVNFDTISNFTGSDEENLQQKLEKLQEENQKLKKTVENQKKELQNMDQELNEMICDSTEKNQQEEDEKLQEENQKLMETGRNLKTEPQNMNKKLKLTGPITRQVVDRLNPSISLQNISSEEIELEGCRLEVQRNNREPDIYHLRRQ